MREDKNNYPLQFLSLSARTTAIIKLEIFGVTSESQNNSVSTNGVNSAMT